MQDYGITKSTNSVLCSNFSRHYANINTFLIESGSLEKSRNGDTLELLNFKTIIQHPERRCVGGHSRNINVFFLLAEAIWIWLGEKDVEFLKTFNERMSDFSDHGEVFHAPYGFRLRNYGVNSMETEKRDFPFDQIEIALQQLSKNPNDRRVVMSIWNPELDLATTSRDLPCNDMVMLKIRDEKLYLTVQNRSNDLHWGLPTNVFQFSFIGEIMANILGVNLGDQVHNSQSLHVYTNNPIALTMLNSSKKGYVDFYGSYNSMPMNIRFETDSTDDRLKEVDSILKNVLLDVKKVIKTPEYKYVPNFEDLHFTKTNKFFHKVSELLKIYVSYTKSPRKENDRVEHLRHVLELRDFTNDMNALAISFFVSRLDKKVLKSNFPVCSEYSYINIDSYSGL